MLVTLMGFVSSQLHLEYNNLGAKGKAAIRAAVSAKEGLELYY